MHEVKVAGRGRGEERRAVVVVGVGGAIRVGVVGVAGCPDEGGRWVRVVVGEVLCLTVRLGARAVSVAGAVLCGSS